MHREPSQAACPKAPHQLQRVVLFDGRCSLCERSRRWTTRLDWFRRVAWVSFREPAVRALVPQLTDEQLEKEMWVFTEAGEMLAGFDGWRSMLRVFPLTTLPALLLYVPPIPLIGRKVYAFIAARRPIHCQLQLPPPTPLGDWRTILDRSAPRCPGYAKGRKAWASEPREETVNQ